MGISRVDARLIQVVLYNAVDTMFLLSLLIL